MIYADDSFNLTAEDLAGNPVTSFNIPITITITYTDSAIGAIPEDSLALLYWDVTANAWTDSVTTCPGGVYTRDPHANWFSLPLCHLTEFGVFGEPLSFFIPVVSR